MDSRGPHVARRVRVGLAARSVRGDRPGRGAAVQLAAQGDRGVDSAVSDLLRRLPAFLAPDVPLWLIVAAALLGGGAHLLNAIPDLDADRVTGIRGLPQRLGARPSLILASLLLLLTTTGGHRRSRPPVWAGALALLASAALPVAGLVRTATPHLPRGDSA